MSSRRFWLKLVVFLLPVALYSAVTIAVPFWLGEYTPLREVAARQMREEVLFARAYRDDFVPFKYQAAVLRQTPVLILGSSRVMEFRSEAFGDNAGAVYNAGGGASSLYQMFSFLRALPAVALPEVLIVGLDQWWFNPNDVSAWADAWAYPLDQEGGRSFNDVMNYSRSFLLELLEAPDSARLLWNGDARRVGIRAVISGVGFRSDGSFNYGAANERDNAEGFARTRARIERRVTGFAPAADYSRPAAQALDDLLAFCREHEIAVVAFLPPFAPSIYDELLARGESGYLALLPAALTEILARYDAPLLDFTDGATVPAGANTDDHYFDGIHGGERVYAAILAALTDAAPETLGAYADADAIRALLNAPGESPTRLFPEPI